MTKSLEVQVYYSSIGEDELELIGDESGEDSYTRFTSGYIELDMLISENGDSENISFDLINFQLNESEDILYRKQINFINRLFNERVGFYVDLFNKRFTSMSDSEIGLNVRRNSAYSNAFPHIRNLFENNFHLHLYFATTVYNKEEGLLPCPTFSNTPPINVQDYRPIHSYKLQLD